QLRALDRLDATAEALRLPGDEIQNLVTLAGMVVSSAHLGAEHAHQPSFPVNRRCRRLRAEIGLREALAHLGQGFAGPNRGLSQVLRPYSKLDHAITECIARQPK